MIEWRKTTTGRCRKLSDVPEGAEIFCVNGRERVGTCEICRGAILEGQVMWHDSDGVMWHAKCSDDDISGAKKKWRTA